MSSIIAISGSPSAQSRTAVAVGKALERLSSIGFDVRHIAVRDLPAEDLLAGRTDSPALSDAIGAVAAADGVIVATPVYKAAYTGLLKSFLDLLPQSGLAGKAVLPLVTGGTNAHVLAIDYALRPVLTSLGARHVVAGCFLLDQLIDRQADGTATLRPEAELRLFDVVGQLTEALPVGSTLAASR
ncbi:NADPH-dependent FMN reductase [Wenjunlia tyrosinilytica]|uniref:FMN reductase (NADPH) n=1 Tax=Wenjunlia tyrosinilytica TaxID=1544741 RepID=A0A918DX56_9ACTN|nr:NADPH-dependent FMN reductase [Wenjunlia tyrosinilytica]GGO87867.1 FMN reductase (NADPH) [Wenjunlia tyrosinilytica]